MFDFLVIGGGIAGLSTASRLAAHGAVLLLEAETDLAYHASGRSAALYEANYGLPSTIALNKASAAYHKSADGGVLSPRGLLLVATAADYDAYCRDRDYMEMQEIGLDEVLSRVPILDPDAVRYTAYEDSAFDIDTHKLTQHFAKGARADGAQIVTRARVDQITKINGGWAVGANGQVYEARIVVNAAGAWADEVATLAGVAPLGLQPYRRSMARILAPGGHDVSTWPMIFGAGETWYAKPDAGCLLVSPADEDPFDPFDAWADDMVLAEGLARYEGYVREPVTQVIANWAGLRTFAPDRNLVIGFDGKEPGFFWVAGQGGYGIQSSPAASQLAADLILGRANELDAATRAALSPTRFAA